MNHYETEVLIDREKIAEKVQELGRTISKDFEELNEPLIVVGVLKGALLFVADLIRAMDIPVELEFIVASSYGDSDESSGDVRIGYKSFESLKDRSILLVDDITDSGRTFRDLGEALQAYEPKEVRFCALLDKPSRRAVSMKADYIGFSIPNAFVVGYGLDFAGRYRELADIAVVKTEEV